MSNPSISRIASYIRLTKPELKDYEPDLLEDKDSATLAAYFVMVSPTILLVHQYLQWTVTGLLCIPLLLCYVLYIWAASETFVAPEKSILRSARMRELYTDQQINTFRNMTQAGMFHLFLTLGVIVSSDISLGNEDLILRISTTVVGATLVSSVFSRARYQLRLRKYRRELETK